MAVNINAQEVTVNSVACCQDYDGYFLYLRDLSRMDNDIYWDYNAD